MICAALLYSLLLCSCSLAHVSSEAVSRLRARDATSLLFLLSLGTNTFSVCDEWRERRMRAHFRLKTSTSVEIRTYGKTRGNAPSALQHHCPSCIPLRSAFLFPPVQLASIFYLHPPRNTKKQSDPYPTNPLSFSHLLPFIPSCFPTSTFQPQNKAETDNPHPLIENETATPSRNKPTSHHPHPRRHSRTQQGLERRRGRDMQGEHRIAEHREAFGGFFQQGTSERRS